MSVPPRCRRAHVLRVHAGLLLCALCVGLGCHHAPSSRDAGTQQPDAARPTDAGTGDAGPLDAQVPADAAQDAGPPGPTKAEIRSCEKDLAASWASSRPVLGQGSAAARGSYARVLGKLMDDYMIPGGSIAVTRNGRLVLAIGLGLADVEAAQPVHPDSLFRIASLSKQITATAIMKLVEAGSLTLDDLAFDRIGGLAPPAGRTMNPTLATITIRNLLQHTGGWNRDKESTGDPMFDAADIAAALFVTPPAQCDTIIRYMLDKPLTYSPGSTTCYSNFGYCVLGRVIEQASGMHYADYVNRAVLEPAGVLHMQLGHSLRDQRADGEVRYYDFMDAPFATSVFPGGARVPWPYGGFYLEAMDAHGGWLASSVDMLRVQLAIDGRATPPDLLSANSRTAMLANPNVPSCTEQGGSTPSSSQSWYGTGLSVNSAGNAWHTGSLPGSASEDVIAQNGFSWSAFFNMRPEAMSTFFTRLDADLWTALQGVETAQWTADDYFDQYTSFGPWMSEDDFERMRNDNAALYPSRLEGRLQDGAVELRAMLVARHAAASPVVASGLNCLEYRAAQDEQVQTGRSLASLQSYLDQRDLRRYQAVWIRTP